MVRTRLAAAVVAAAAVALAGCTAASTTPSSAPVGSSPAQPTVTVTVTATPSATPSASPIPSPASSGPDADGGCRNGITTIPAGASTGSIPGADADGKADTQFYSSDPLEYGIRTAAGGVYTLKDDLAGPASHHGWTAALDASPGHVTVLDDGRTATLHAFVDCRFVTTLNAQGQSYTFTLNGFGDRGTGVACNDRNGGTILEGVDAVKRSNGRYDIRWTQIDISADGRRATNGTTETRWSNLAASDPRVAASRESHCTTTPEVSVPNE